MDKTQRLNELPPLEKLYFFLTVSEIGNISQAAIKLNKTQSTISKNIALLEENLGVRLFDRRQTGVLLRKEAHIVAFRTQRAIAHLQSGLGSSGIRLQALLSEKRLGIFIELERLHHMPTVATIFGLSQPAISQAIKILENGLKHKLFNRTQKGLIPSFFARELSINVRKAFNELRIIRSELEKLQDKIVGTVYVGALPLGRAKLLPEAIVRLHDKYKNIQVVTSESPFEILASELRSGDIDFILGAIRKTNYASDLISKPLIQENLALVVRKDHPLKDVLDLNKIPHSISWIFPRKNSPSRMLIEKMFLENLLLLPSASVETGDLAIIRELLLGTDMIAVLSAHQIDYEISRGDIIKLKIDMSGTQREIGVTVRKNSTPSPAANLLIEEIMNMANVALK